MTDAPLMSLAFTLPWPPSVNTYWRHTVRGGKFKKAKAMVFLSEHGERYRTHAMLSMNVQRVPRHALKGRLAVHIVAYPPDRRARDLDNLPKGVLDAMKHANVIIDDSYIDDLHLVRGPVRPGGLLEMVVREITHEPITVEMVLEHDKPAPIRRKYIADWNRALALDPHAVVRPFVMAQREGMDDEILSWAKSPPPF